MINKKINKPIKIEEPTETVDSNGMVTQDWTTYYDTRARIAAAIGREYYQAKQVTSDQSVKFVLRYCDKAAGITTKMRISYNSNYYDIESAINPYEDNREIVLQAVLQNA